MERLHVDGILNLDFAKFLAEGTGSVHGIDSSAKMIASARDLCKDYNNCTFEGMLAESFSRWRARNQH